MDDNALRLSAALAYYSVFSIAPLLVLAVGLAGWFLGSKAASGHLFLELKGVVGASVAQAMEAMVKSASQPAQSLTATIVGVVTMLIGASGVFGQLKDALNTIWEVRIKPGVTIKAFIRERLLSFGMVLVIGFLLLVSFLLTAILSAFNHWIAGLLRLPEWLWGGAGLLASFGIITLLFALIFKVLPDVKIPWRHVWVGAAFTALFFELGKFGLAYYLGKESTVSSFGSAGSVVLLLLWVYYASCILLFGAEFTKVYAEAHGGHLQPSELATPVTAEARLQQGLDPGDAPAIPTPARESLTSIFPIAPPEPAPDVSASAMSLNEAREYLCAHPTKSMMVALGCGLTAGLLSRAGENRAADPSPYSSHPFQSGSKLIGTALLLLGIRLRKRLLQKLRDTFTPHAWQALLNRLPRR